jgi:hypothetical protein
MCERGLVTLGGERVASAMLLVPCISGLLAWQTATMPAPPPRPSVANRDSHGAVSKRARGRRSSVPGLYPSVRRPSQPRAHRGNAPEPFSPEHRLLIRGTDALAFVRLPSLGPREV